MTVKKRKCPRCHGKGWLNPSRYKTGRTFEYKVRDYFKDRGYTVYRAYASKGIFDLIAQKGDWFWGIQVKNLSSKNKSYLTPKDRANLTLDLINRKYTIEIWAGGNKTKDKVLGPISGVLHIYHDGGMKINKLRTDVFGNKWEEFKL